ncbi:MAG: SGNH/GDSL hydrolase family protein [Candidatus Obscuribacterales bacterium]|nr:SGNH/GDSL hydrolase family protein [Candidatus Obscuribacterales bacterium]
MSPVTTSPTVKTPAESLKKPRSKWRMALETTAFLAVSVALLEWFLPIAGVGQEEFLQPDTKLGCRHIPSKYVVWRMEGFSRGHLNSTGLRDVEHNIEKKPGTIRVALLGDSSTEGLQVPLEDTYARIVEQQLNANGTQKYEVINFACSSYSTGQQHEQFLNEVTTYKPDITVLLYNRGDAVENIRKPGKLNVEPRPYFYLDQQGNLQPDNSVLNYNKAKLSPNPVFDFLRAHSSIYGVLSSTHLALCTNEPLYGKLKNAFDWLSNLGNTNKNVSNVLYPEQNAFEVTRSLLLDLNKSCKANNSKFVLLVFPNTLGDLDLAYQAKQLLTLSKEENFPSFDLTQSFYDSGNPGALFLEYHFSSAGHKVVADQLTKLLQKT